MGDNFERNRNGKKSYHPDRPLEKFCHEDSGRKGRVDPSQSLESVWISAEQPRDLPVAPEVSSPLRQETAQCGGVSTKTIASEQNWTVIPRVAASIPKYEPSHVMSFGIESVKPRFMAMSSSQQ